MKIIMLHAVYAENPQDPAVASQREAKHGGNSLFLNVFRVLKVVPFVYAADDIGTSLDDLAIDGASLDVDAPHGEVILTQTVCGGKLQILFVIIKEFDGARFNPHNGGCLAGSCIQQVLQVCETPHLFDHFIEGSQFSIAGVELLGNLEEPPGLGLKADLH